MKEFNVGVVVQVNETYALVKFATDSWNNESAWVVRSDLKVGDEVTVYMVRNRSGRWYKAEKR